MGASSCVVGFRPADAKWKQMKSIWDNCELTGIDIPDEVSDFFDGEDPGDKPGAEVELGDAVAEWSADMQEGYEIDVTKLPKDVTVIRAYTSYE